MRHYVVASAEPLKAAASALKHTATTKKKRRPTPLSSFNSILFPLPFSLTSLTMADEIAPEYDVVVLGTGTNLPR
jgi:hypothetical protein